MNIWWKLTRYNTDIVPVEVVKETAAKIRYIDRRWDGSKGSEEVANKVSEYYHFYPSFQEAKAALLDRLKATRERASRESEQATATIAKVLEMEEPQWLPYATP